MFVITITITPQQARQLNEIGGQHGRGIFPGAFDPDDWAGMASMIDVPVYGSTQTEGGWSLGIAGRAANWFGAAP